MCTTGCADGPGANGNCGNSCPLGQVCINGQCYPKPCQSTGECPLGYECNDGFCEQDPGCENDDDCPDGRCIDGHCYTIECQDGDTKVCSTDCGEGEQLCVNGVWQTCDAPQPQDEVCGDEVDNNCDGNTDEGCGGCLDGEERTCENACGTGLEWCHNGYFRGCTAPQPFMEVCGDGVDNDCNELIDEDCELCSEGEERVCETECGTGNEVCREGEWQGCDAVRPYPEMCDGEDNDCDGNTDETLFRDCTTACGSGYEVCQDLSWQACSAPVECDCDEEGAVDQQACGHCGIQERTCTSGAWSDWGECLESGECVPAEAETRRCGLCGNDRRVCTLECNWGPWEGCIGEGVCVADEIVYESCGPCGETRMKVCLDDCTWTGWSECSEPPVAKECEPGQEETRDCEQCSIERRLCLDNCLWGEWGECEIPPDSCEPGEQDAQSCGSCQVQIRECLADCTWGEFGECLTEGQCIPGEREEEACGNCGLRERTCNGNCIWNDWGNCQGEGPCQPDETQSGSCGLCLDQENCGIGECLAGTHTRTCQADCWWADWGNCHGNVDPSTDICGDGIDQDCNGVDARQEDQYEPNDNCTEAQTLGDDPSWSVTRATIDIITDRDVYTFKAIDNWGSEDILVWLEDIPYGCDYDICLYSGTNNCEGDNALACSTNDDNASEHIHWDETWSDDDGDYYVIVSRYRGNSCTDQYLLTVHGLH